MVGFGAFEAHVINVTATIENALSVIPDHIAFGTVFPQEAINKDVKISLSQSFIDEERVDDVNYVIRQKPKCIRNEKASSELPMYGRVVEETIVDGLVAAEQIPPVEFVCEDDENYTIMPVLCPFLSKTPDGIPGNDTGILAFHGPIADWDLADTIGTQASGRLAKSEQDTEDIWKIDFRVPCFKDQCAQDWAKFVTDNNPEAEPADYILPANLEHAQFGCDLWIETTGISKSNQIGIYKEEGDSTTMLGPRIGTLKYTATAGLLSGTVKIDTAEGLDWIKNDDHYLLVLNGPRTGTTANGGTNQLLAQSGCNVNPAGYGSGWDGWWSNRATDNTGVTDTNCSGIHDLGDSGTPDGSALTRMEGYYNFMFDVTGLQLKAGVAFNATLLTGSYNEVQFLIKNLDTANWNTVGEYPGAGEIDGLTSYFDFSI